MLETALAVVRSRCEQTTSPPNEEMHVPQIMKLTDVGSAAHEVEPYLADPSYLLQQKFDGTRIQVQYRPITGEVLFSNDGLKPVTHAAAKLKCPALEAELTPLFELVESPVTIEGELLIRTGEFIVWDLLLGDDPNGWATTEQRLADLTNLLESAPGLELVKLSPTARTEDEKRALWQRILESNVEGGVSKHRSSYYLPGIRSKEWVKHKLVKSADLIVTSAERVFKPEGPGRPANTVVHKGSAGLGFWKDGQVVTLTAASLIGKDLTIDVGDVVEIEYLYREPGGSPVQPRITRKRWDVRTSDGDKRPEDCTEDQFPEYSRAVC